MWLSFVCFFSFFVFLSPVHLFILFVFSVSLPGGDGLSLLATFLSVSSCLLLFSPTVFPV